MHETSPLHIPPTLNEAQPEQPLGLHLKPEASGHHPVVQEEEAEDKANDREQEEPHHPQRVQRLNPLQPAEKLHGQGESIDLSLRGWGWCRLVLAHSQTDNRKSKKQENQTQNLVETGEIN